MNPDHERLDEIRRILGHLEASPGATLTEAVKVQIAAAWRIVEASEPDEQGRWQVTVRDPESEALTTVGIGYHAGHGFDPERAVATFRYALHRAALRSVRGVDDAQLFEALHTRRGRLEVTGLARLNPDEEDTWHVLLDPGAVHRRPRLPITETVQADEAVAAEALARWNASRQRRTTPLTQSTADEHVRAMYDPWRLADIRKVLPTIYALAAAVCDLNLAIPDDPEGRRLRRWIRAIADQRPSETDFVTDSPSRLR